MWRRMLLRLLLLSERLLQTHAFPGVVLPVQQLLFIDEFGTLSIDQLLPEVLVLQQLQHVQTVRVPVEKRRWWKNEIHQHIQISFFSKWIHWNEPVIYCQSVMMCADDMSTSNILEVLGIFRLLPIQQVLEVVNKGFLSKDTSLGQNCIEKTKTILGNQLRLGQNKHYIVGSVWHVFLS